MFPFKLSMQCAPSCGAEVTRSRDITEELFASGELKTKIDEALGAEHPQTGRTVALAVA